MVAELSTPGTGRILPLRNRSSGLLAVLFVLSMLVPILIPLGPVLLIPYRILLLIGFIPLTVMLFSGRAGRVLIIDWLIAFSAAWAALSIFANHGGVRLEAAGIHVVEFFGAYVLGRVSIRTAEDFRMFTRAFFFVVLFLLPFAALESITRRPVLLNLIPQSVGPTDAGIRMGMRRAQTVFAHPILYGAFVSTGLGLFWYVMRPKITRLYTVPMVGFATIFSLSTGALIALVFQTLFIAWEMVTKALHWRWRLFVGLSVLFYVLVDLLSNRTPFHVVVSYASFNTGSAYNRILIWQYGTDNVAANPIFGIGFEDWARPSWMSPSIDNFWLVIAIRYGLPAIIPLLIALYLAVRWVARQPLSDPFDKACRAGYLTALGGIVVAGSTVHYWHSIMSFVLFFLGAGLWVVTGGAKGGAKTEEASDDDDEAAAAAAPGGPLYTRSDNTHKRPVPEAPRARRSPTSLR